MIKQESLRKELDRQKQSYSQNNQNIRKDFEQDRNSGFRAQGNINNILK